MQGESLREELLSRAKTVKVLPTLNTIMDKAFRVLNDKNSSFGQLMDVIKYDQAISCKIVSIANSAFYSRGVPIMTLQRAMISVGFDEIKNIVTCLIFMDNILKQLKLKEEDLKALWKHSLMVAYAAKVLAGKTMLEDPEKMFTVSLLHDIGKVILYMQDPEYRQTFDEAQRAGKDVCAFERTRYGIDHQEIGYYMSMKWRFPEEFTNVIRHHHGMVGENGDPLVRTVRIVDRFCMNPEADLGVEGLILVQERENIENQIEKITELLGSL
jgi:putative nucleotidyltransferase with HDIG domain